MISFVTTKVLIDFQIGLISTYTNTHCFHCIRKTLVALQLPLGKQNVEKSIALIITTTKKTGHIKNNNCYQIQRGEVAEQALSLKYDKRQAYPRTDGTQEMTDLCKEEDKDRPSI